MLPKVPKRATASSPQSSVSKEGSWLTSVGDKRPPTWYKDLIVKKTRGKNEANVDTLLQSLREQIKKCSKPEVSKDKTALKATFDKVRGKIHRIVFIEVSGPLLRLNRMLHNEDGLPQLFDQRFNKGVDWPFDIKADAEELYNKVSCIMLQVRHMPE